MPHHRQQPKSAPKTPSQNISRAYTRSLTPRTPSAKLSPNRNPLLSHPCPSVPHLWLKIPFLRIVGNDVRRESLPIIVISGFDRAEVFSKLSSIPVRPFLAKGDPNFFEKLLHTVGSLVSRDKKRN